MVARTPSVRHNEEKLNAELAALVPWSVPESSLDSPHVKALLLLQAHCLRLPLPIADYTNDTKTVLDQVPRVLNALVDIAADAGMLHCALHVMRLSQMLAQAQWLDAPTLMQVPGMTTRAMTALLGAGIETLAQLRFTPRERVRPALAGSVGDAAAGKVGAAARACAFCRASLSPRAAPQMLRAVDALPFLRVGWQVRPDSEDGGAAAAPAASAKLQRDSEFRATPGADCVLDVRLELPPGAVRPCAASRSPAGPRLTPGSLAQRTALPAARGGKSGEFSWWLALGCEAPTAHGQPELVALKRVTVTRALRTQLRFQAPAREGDSTLTLYVISDCMAGLDQEYTMTARVAEAAEDGGGSEGGGLSDAAAAGDADDAY